MSSHIVLNIAISLPVYIIFGGCELERLFTQMAIINIIIMNVRHTTQTLRMTTLTGNTSSSVSGLSVEELGPLSCAVQDGASACIVDVHAPCDDPGPVGKRSGKKKTNRGIIF